MWFLTTEGFYSAVEETKLKAHLGQISVRAREPGALDMLRERYMPELSETSVTPSGVVADYRYRAWIGKADFGAGLARVGEAVDYPNFKSEVARKRGLGRYEKALHEVWSILGRLQPGGPYGYGGASYPPIPKGEPGITPRLKKRGGRKKGQSKLPLSFEGGAPQTCDDCGRDLPEGEGAWYGSRFLCRDVGKCVNLAGTTA